MNEPIAQSYLLTTTLSSKRLSVMTMNVKKLKKQTPNHPKLGHEYSKPLDAKNTTVICKLRSNRCSEKLLFRKCSEILSEASAFESLFAKVPNTQVNKNGIEKKKRKKDSTIQVMLLTL